MALKRLRYANRGCLTQVQANPQRNELSDMQVWLPARHEREGESTQFGNSGGEWGTSGTRHHTATELPYKNKSFMFCFLAAAV